MAKYKEIQVTATKLVSLERKSLSKMLDIFPAISQAKAVEGMAPKTAYWPLYTCLQAELAKMGDEGDRILSFFKKRVNAAEVRHGFSHTETGRALAHVVTTTPAPGDSLCYTVQEFMRIQEEVEKNDPIHLRVGVNTTLLQYAQNFVDYDQWQMVIGQVASTAAIALKDAMKGMIYSLLLGSTPKAFVKNFYMDRVFHKNLQLTNDSESKLAKELYDQNKKYVALCKLFAGQFGTKLKNRRYINPLLRTIGDLERRGDYKAEKPLDLSDENAVKTALAKRYCVGGQGNDKNSPPKHLTRDACIFAAIEAIRTTVSDLTRIPAVENGMTYDPSSTAQDTDSQFPVMANVSDLVLFMHPHDLEEVKNGNVGYMGTGGYRRTSPGIADLGLGGMFGVDGMLPGNIVIIDRRCVGIVPILQRTFENFNKWELVDQVIGHTYIKWFVFCKFFAGVELYMTKWIPSTTWITEFRQYYEAA